MAALEQAIELKRRSKYKEALPFFRQAVQEQPGESIAWAGLSYMLLQLRENDQEALEAANKALDINPHSAEAWAMKGLALNMQNPPRPEEGIYACDEALKLDPNLVVAYCNKGRIFFEQEDYTQALAAFNEALKRDSFFLDALLGKMAAHGLLQEDERALQTAERVIGIDPNSSAAWRCKASIYWERKDLESAWSAVNRILAINPNDSNGLFLKAAILDDQGKHKEALTILNHAAEVDPHNELVTGGRDAIQQGLHDQRVDKAVGCLAVLGEIFVNIIKVLAKDISK